MAKSGWKKYDKLPARVGLIDVDALRFELGRLSKKLFKIQEQLDKAKELNKKRN